MEFLQEYWLVVLVAVPVAALIAYFLLRPRQRVELSKDPSPVRPHMQARQQHEGRGIAAEAAAAVSDVSGQFIDAPVHANLPGASGPPDDLTKLKGRVLRQLRTKFQLIFQDPFSSLNPPTSVLSWFPWESLRS